MYNQMAYLIICFEYFKLMKSIIDLKLQASDFVSMEIYIHFTTHTLAIYFLNMKLKL